MGPFHVNNTFGCHLGRHLVSIKLSNDEMIMMQVIYFHNLLTITEQFRNNTSIILGHFM